MLMTKLNLEELRENIDKADKKLLEILAERFSLTQKVGEYKKEHNLEALAQGREERVFKARKEWADEFEIDSTLIKQIFTLIMEDVKTNNTKFKNYTS